MPPPSHLINISHRVINVLSTLFLLMHMGPIGRISRAAVGPTWSGSVLEGLRADLAVKSGAALVVLVVATALAVYKPQGRTPYGQRRRHEQRTASAAEAVDAATAARPVGSVLTL